MKHYVNITEGTEATIIQLTDHKVAQNFKQSLRIDSTHSVWTMPNEPKTSSVGGEMNVGVVDDSDAGICKTPYGPRKTWEEVA